MKSSSQFTRELRQARHCKASRPAPLTRGVFEDASQPADYRQFRVIAGDGTELLTLRFHWRAEVGDFVPILRELLDRADPIVHTENLHEEARNENQKCSVDTGSRPVRQKRKARSQRSDVPDVAVAAGGTA